MNTLHFHLKSYARAALLQERQKNGSMCVVFSNGLLYVFVKYTDSVIDIIVETFCAVISPAS